MNALLDFNDPQAHLLRNHETEGGDEMNAYEPAFPKPAIVRQDGLVDSDSAYTGNQGLTIRAYIATAALHGLIACSETTGERNEFASEAVNYADALIAELNKPIKPITTNEH
jgi:hypothetical protein